jgi:hypothetical protein
VCELKSITKIKRMIQKLNSKECWELSTYCKEIAQSKAQNEHNEAIKAIGVGGKVLVRGGNSDLVQKGLACLVGTIVKFTPKCVHADLPHKTRPGVWRIPWCYLLPATEENVKKETESMRHTIAFNPYLKELNRMLAK